MTCARAPSHASPCAMDSSDIPRFDIAIVGGGMVGASLACALARTTLRVAMIEAVALDAPNQPSYDDRTIALAYGGRRIYEAMGLWDEVATQGISPILGIHISDRGRFGFTRLRADALGVPALGYVIENRILGRTLYAHLREADNVELFCPVSLESIQVEDGIAELRLRHDGTMTRLRARLVVAADGADSAVRQAMGITAVRTDYEQSAVVTNVTPGRPHNNIAYERFTETGPLAVLPMRDERCAIVWGARREQVEAMLGWSDDEFLARLQQRFGDRLGEFARIGRRAAYPLFLTRVQEHVRPRLALIGNAAHTVHPVAGQGFNLGLRDVAALAEVLVRAAQAGEDIGALPVLQRYARWRARDNRVIATFTDVLVKLFSTDFLPLALARNAGLIAVDLLPPVKRALMRITSGLAGRLPRLARGLPLR